MKKCIFKALILTLILGLSSKSLANNEVFSESDFNNRKQTFTAETNILYLSKVFANPHPGFVPDFDIIFLDFLENLKQYPDAKTLEVFRILKMASEYYKKIYNENLVLKDTILIEMSKMTTKALSYFKKSRNELGVQYFTNLDLYIAKQSIPGNSNLENKAQEEKRSAEQEKLIQQKIETIYLDFLVNYKMELKDQNRTALKILIDEAEKLRKKLRTANKGDTGQILFRMQQLAPHALRFFSESKNEFGIKYFTKYAKSIEAEINFKSLQTEEAFRMQEKAAMEVLLVKFELDILSFTKNNKEKKLKSAVQVFKYKGSDIEVSFREVKSSHRNGNVTYLAPLNNRERVYTAKVLVPSVDSNKAILIAAKTLLTSGFVDGIYFDDQLRIPSGLNSYEISSLGSNVLLKRAMCSGLFH